MPCLELTNDAHVASIWSRQFSGRISGDDFNFPDWLLNIPRSLAYLLPWAVLFPFARFDELPSHEERKFSRALALGIAAPLVIVNLLPEALPRYTMPLLAPAIWLLAIFLRAHALVWPKKLRRAIIWTVAGITAAMLVLFARHYSIPDTTRKTPAHRGANQRGHST